MHSKLLAPLCTEPQTSGQQSMVLADCLGHCRTWFPDCRDNPFGPVAPRCPSGCVQSFGMVDLSAQLGNDVFDRMMRGVARGRYQALLGAGASADSCDADGWSLPSAEVLQQNLRVAFDLPDDSRANLRRTYQMAKDRTSTFGLTMSQYLKQHFTDTELADWLQDLLMLQWSGALVSPAENARWEACQVENGSPEN